MKSKYLSMLTLLLASGALVLPACSKLSSPSEEKEEEVVEPPVEDFTETDGEVNYKSRPFRVVREEENKLVLPDKVILHYHNDDNNCLTRRFYTWTTGVDGTERKPRESDWTATDMSIELDFNLLTEYAGFPSLSFIIKVAGTWAGQSEDTIIDYSLYQDVIIENNKVLELWTIPGEGTSVEMYKSKAESELPKIKTAKFTDFKTIHCTSSIDADGKKWVASEYHLYAYDKNFLNMSDAAQALNKDYYEIKHGVPTGNEFDIVFNTTAKINVQYVVESKFPGFDRWQKCIVGSENLYSQERFDRYYTYDGELGMIYSPEKITFRIWSPISANVLLNLYDTGTPKIYGGNDDKDVYKMAYKQGGVWETEFPNDGEDSILGSYYTFTLTNSSGTVETVDPYVKACGLNGIRGYVYNNKSAEANPDGWDTVPQVWDGVAGYDINTPQDLSVYEVHIRDLTMDSTWQSNNNNARGSYNAFVERGTTLTKSGKTVTTGFDHLKELGVNAVQLLPVFDQDNDERLATDDPDFKFNWGYNPLNYNCVEGAYSTHTYDPENPDSYDPLIRIREFKNLVKEFAHIDDANGRHTRVIMDVVYNHVSSATASSFNKIMPKYYFRYTKNWEYYDGSGCNNEFKSDAKMGTKFIVDSLHWWATEYKIKGFRFDLMGLIDCWTLDAAKQDLYDNVDKDIVMYGEGWTSGGYHGRAILRDKFSDHVFEVQDYGGQSENWYDVQKSDGTWEHIQPYFNDGRVFELIKGGADNGQTYKHLYHSDTSHGQVGGFNDDGRDETKGRNDDGYNNNPYPQFGYISKGWEHVGNASTTVVNMLKGNNTRAPGANPAQTINYMSCHDNYTLWDQLRYTLGSNHDKDTHVAGTAPTIKETIEASLGCHAAVMLSNGVAFMQGGEELYRTKTYSYDLDDYNNKQSKPKADGSPATVRPYPNYPHYDKDPNVVTATQEVDMYGDVISHNSYKSPDYVNSFKWDRKIEITFNKSTFSTYAYNEVWQKMIAARRSMTRVDYHTMWEEHDESIYNAWGNGDGNCIVAGWCRLANVSGRGYGFLFANRSGGTFNWTGIDVENIVFSNLADIKLNGSTVSMPKYGFICYRLRG